MLGSGNRVGVSCVKSSVLDQLGRPVAPTGLPLASYREMGEIGDAQSSI